MKDIKTLQVNVPEEELKEALECLLEKGYVEQLTSPDGEVLYRLTELGAAVGNHMDSDPAARN